MPVWGAGSESRSSLNVRAAVLLLSATGLMFELTLTRIFSATIWYHYAFVAISVALFGWGLGGLLVCGLRSAWLDRRRADVLVVLALLLAIAIPAFPYAILRFPFHPRHINYYFVMSLLPFLAGGAALSLAFESYGRDSNRLYFADLAGAALGVLAVPVVIRVLGAETAMLGQAVLPALAAVLLGFSTVGPRRRIWLTLGALAVAAGTGLTLWNLRTQRLTIRDAPEKALYRLLAAHPQAKIETDRWNAYSRITSVTGFDDYHVARLFIDSDAETSVLRWNGTPADPPDARGWFRAFPFRLVPRPSVLVIGPGGGTDVVMALAAGSPKVTAVEMNPLIVEAVRRFGAAAGDLYDHPAVELVMEEGRNFIERTDRRFDLIVLGFVDSWASVASGGLALTESYLYTRDALAAYYDHLTDGGAVVIIRWPTDVPRLVANSVSLLMRRGVSLEEAGRHILAAGATPARGDAPVETVFMLSRSPLTSETVDRLLAGHDGSQVIWAPGRPSLSPYADLFARRLSFESYTQAFPGLATPVHDDHPFYFATDKPYGIPSFVTYLLRTPVLGVTGLGLAFLIGARLLGLRAPGLRAVAYFGALGVGFIICEVALLQRLILLLGHPIYTLVVLLFTLLMAGGLGSQLARRIPPERIRARLGMIIPGVIVLVVLGGLLLPEAVRAAMPLGLGARIAVAGGLIFPYGLLMGMPFPLGLRRAAEDPNGPPVSALWGINGVASVIGSVGGMMLAVAAGFTWVFLAGAVCYAVALAARPR